MNNDILEASNIIRHGGVVAFPTETVYGLGADATNDIAVQKIFRIKNRPAINPLIVHINEIEQASEIAVLTDNIYLLSQFWPGALTIIANLKAGNKIAKSVLAGLSTVAIRIPSHPTARKLIELSAAPIAAPSANLSGYVSATSSLHVISDFTNDEVTILNDDSHNSCGLESTIIDTTTTIPTILRHGYITQNVIESLLGKKIIGTLGNNTSIKAPGMLAKHYSPNTRLRLNATKLKPDEVGLNFGDSNLLGSYCLNLSEAGDLSEAASNLYSMLRILDNYCKNNNFLQIAIAEVPNYDIGVAINDRLQRAACQ